MNSRRAAEAPAGFWSFEMTPDRAGPPLRAAPASTAPSAAWSVCGRVFGSMRQCRCLQHGSSRPGSCSGYWKSWQQIPIRCSPLTRADVPQYGNRRQPRFRHRSRSPPHRRLGSRHTNPRDWILRYSGRLSQPTCMLHLPSAGRSVGRSTRRDFRKATRSLCATRMQFITRTCRNSPRAQSA